MGDSWVDVVVAVAVAVAAAVDTPEETVKLPVAVVVVEAWTDNYGNQERWQKQEEVHGPQQYRERSQELSVTWRVVYKH